MKQSPKKHDQISFQTSVVMEEYYDSLEEQRKKKHQLISDITQWKYMTKVNHVRNDRRTKDIKR